MLVPLSWLRDFAPFGDDVDALVDTANELGFVVEGVQKVGGGIGDVVVARVLEVGAIEGADRIRRVRVDAGAPDPTPVVCGAWNFEAGDTVAFAPVGSVLPGDFAIGKRKMKGVESHGMICSARELELGTDAEGIMLLDGALIPGTPLVEALGIVPDTVLDLAIEGNRPDALCIAGIARDMAARLGLPFELAEPAVTLPGAGDAGPSVRVDAPDLCPVFTATLLTGVTIGPSPSWLATRLTLAGMRPLNTAVDISNYVMLELGQPTHPYDAHRLPGGGLSVRRAEPGEQLTTLDGETRTLGAGDDCVIGDAHGAAVGIGAIMGGGSSEIHDGTMSIVLEAAWFDPMAIARTSKRLGLRSEASIRFEKGVDVAGVERAVARYCELAVALCGATVGPRTTWSSEEHAPRPATLTMRTERVNGLLGTDLSPETIDGYLTAIGFTVTRESAERAVVTAPSWRPDVTIEEALIEEIARHHGYGNIEHAVPTAPRVGGLTARQRELRFVRDVLCGLGIHEAMSSPLLGPGDHARAGLPESDRIVADRPLALEESVLRGSLLPGLLRSIALNVGRRASETRLFEVGKVWDPSLDAPAPEEPDRRAVGAAAGLPVESERIAVVLWPAEATDATAVWDLLSDALRVESPAVTRDDAPAGLHPTRVAVARAGSAVVGVLGEVDPAVVEAWGIEGRVAWLDLDATALHLAERRPEKTVDVSRFPSSDIDLAFVVGEDVSAADIGATLRSAAGPLLTDLALFDVYRGHGVGEGGRSLAYRLRFCALDRTLTDAEVGERRAAAIKAVESGHGATLRG